MLFSLVIAVIPIFCLIYCFSFVSDFSGNTSHGIKYTFRPFFLNLCPPRLRPYRVLINYRDERLFFYLPVFFPMFIKRKRQISKKMIHAAFSRRGRRVRKLLISSTSSSQALLKCLEAASFRQQGHTATLRTIYQRIESDRSQSENGIRDSSLVGL